MLGKELLTFLMLSLELIDEVVNETVVEVLTTQVSVTGGGLDLEDARLDGQEGHIKGTTAKIEDEDVALADSLLVKTIGDSSRGGFVDDSENVHSRDGGSILCSLPLRVIEVCGDGDDSVVNGAISEVRFSGYLHLEENHRRDFFGRLEKLIQS